MKDYLSILRIHIVLIAIFGTLVFGWLMTGDYLIWVALIGGLDWMLINLANRVSDLAEDALNNIPGSRRVAAAPSLFLGAYVIVLLGSLLLTHLLIPELTLWRVVIQITGFLYNFRVIPGKEGRTRMKNLYFFKNLMSAIGFFITCFAYPLAVAGPSLQLEWVAIVSLVLYFLPFELTYEIFYDMRDVEGDRREGVPTYPVVHGEKGAHRIINALLAISIVILTMSFLLGFVGAREMLLAGGPVIQFFLLRTLIRRGVTTGQCIWVTHFGSALLCLFLIGTALWLMAGLPANIFL